MVFDEVIPSVRYVWIESAGYLLEPEEGVGAAHFDFSYDPK
jgi:hypothetical protein